MISEAVKEIHRWEGAKRERQRIEKLIEDKIRRLKIPSWKNQVITKTRVNELKKLLKEISHNKKESGE